MNLLEHLERRSRASLLVMGVALVVVLCALDYAAGPDVSLILFYLAPIFLAAWFVGRRAGIVLSLLSGASWLVVAATTESHFPDPAIPYWNVAMRFGLILIISLTVSAFKRTLENERALARTDYLTGAENSRSFYELADAEISRARRHNHPFTVAFMDIDDFKLVNDRFGHNAGDALLRAVATTIKFNVRTIDVVARLGGDEFAVLLPETGDAAAQVVFRRIRQNLVDVAQRNKWPVSLSVGAVTWETPPASVDEMLRATDALMYAAKRTGKNTVRHRVATQESATAA